MNARSLKKDQRRISGEGYDSRADSEKYTYGPALWLTQCSIIFVQSLNSSLIPS